MTTKSTDDGDGAVTEADESCDDGGGCTASESDSTDWTDKAIRSHVRACV